jgi:hypothetical protein
MNSDPRLICSALDGFDGWDARAVDVEIAPALVVRVAALDDIIDSKRRAFQGRAHALAYLESLRDEIEHERNNPST